jgi:hypothetical protein
MADPVLTAGQYSIGTSGDASAFVYGGRTGFSNSIQVARTDIDPGSQNIQDSQVVGHDGVLFGTDTETGMVITQTGQAYVRGNGLAAMDAFDSMAGVWTDPSVRLQAGKVVVLRAWYPGSTVVRRAYGRGRRIIPATGLVNQGMVPFVAEFQAADSTWYSDTDHSLVMTMVPSPRGGFTTPMTTPMQLASATNFQQGTISNTGANYAWPVVTIAGPITNPGIKYPGVPVTVSYQDRLTGSDTLVIDTRPWARTVLLNGSNVAGRLNGDPMIALQLPPGSTTVRFQGQDFTGSATMTIRWRNAYKFIGGSVS